MTGLGPTSQRPQDGSEFGAQDVTASTAHSEAAPASGAGHSHRAPAPSPAAERAGRLTAANMLRSLLPLVVICLLLVGWQSLQQEVDEGVRVVDPSSAVQLAAARADYTVVAPEGLGADYLPTSARTDAGEAGEGDPVTLEIGYLTPSQEFAGFVVSDDQRAAPLRAVLDGAEEQGTVEVAGETWTRETTERGELALVRESDGVTVVVTGSATAEELQTVAASVRPWAG